MKILSFSLRRYLYNLSNTNSFYIHILIQISNLSFFLFIVLAVRFISKLKDNKMSDIEMTPTSPSRPRSGRGRSRSRSNQSRFRTRSRTRTRIHQACKLIFFFNYQHNCYTIINYQILYRK